MKARTKRLFNGTARIQRDNYSNSSTGTSWWSIRKEVFDRDGGRCRAIVGGRVCGRPGADVHHVLALSRGGTSTKANLITVCKDCHEARHSHMRHGDHERPKPKNPWGRKPALKPYKP